MTKTILGKVALTPRGTYNETTAYERLDVITHQGSSYLVLQPFSGIEPGTANGCVMLLASKGDQGPPFTYDDLTPAQLASLKGEEGKGFKVRGQYETLLDLEALITEPEAGDAYAVGTEAPYEIYSYDATREVWINLGPLEGPQGETGETGKSAYEIAVENGFEGTEKEWLSQWVNNGENRGEVLLKAPAITLQSEEDLYLQTDGKVFYNEEEVATLSDLTGLVNREELQEKINQLGAVTYIALITANYADVEALENLRPGAIALVRESEPAEQNNYKEYIWLSEEEGWEFLGMVAPQKLDPEDYYRKEEVDEKLSGKVSLTGEETITGRKNFLATIYGGASVFSGGKTKWDEGAGCYIGHDGTIHMNHATGGSSIQLHYANSTETTSQIRETASGKIDIEAKNGLTWNGGGVFAKRETITEANVDTLPGFGLFPVMGGGLNANLPVNYGTLLQFQNMEEKVPGTSNSWPTQVLFSSSVGRGGIPYVRQRENLGNWSEWKQLAIVDQTPQYGTFTYINSNWNLAPVLLEKIHDLRFTISGIGSGTIPLYGFSGGVEGMEYKLTFNNPTAGALNVTLPTGENYQSNVTRWTIAAGKIGELSIRYVYGKYIMRILS